MVEMLNNFFSINSRNYLHLLFQTEDIEDVMRIYDYLVPNIYTPELNVIEVRFRTQFRYVFFFS